MSDQESFDARLAARFEEERRQVPADSFVADTMRKVRAERKGRDFLRVGLRVAAVVALVIASPWLISGVERLNDWLGFSLTWTKGQSGAWILGALAILVVLATRARSR